MRKSTCCVSKRARGVQIPRLNVKSQARQHTYVPSAMGPGIGGLLRFTGHQPSGRLSERPYLKQYLMSSSGLYVHMGICTYTNNFS